MISKRLCALYKVTKIRKFWRWNFTWVCLDHSHYIESLVSAASTKRVFHVKQSNKFMQVNNVKNGKLFHIQGKSAFLSHHLNQRRKEPL